MGIWRDRRDKRVALDIVAGTWADPTGSYYEVGLSSSIGAYTTHDITIDETYRIGLIQ